MPEYIPNKTSLDQKSIKNEEPGREKKQAVVPSDSVKPKEKSLFRKMVDEFTTVDGKDIGEYLLLDMLVPALKSTAQNMVNRALEMIFYGGSGYRSNNYNSYTPYNYNNSRTSMRQYASNNYNNYEPNYSRTPYGYDFTTVEYYEYVDKNSGKVVRPRESAEMVLYKMRDAIIEYRYVTVADYLDWSGYNSSFTDWNYGWTTLNNVTIRTAFKPDGREIAYLDLPKPVVIEK